MRADRSSAERGHAAEIRDADERAAVGALPALAEGGRRAGDPHEELPVVEVLLRRAVRLRDLQAQHLGARAGQVDTQAGTRSSSGRFAL